MDRTQCDIQLKVTIRNGNKKDFLKPNRW